MPATPTNHLFFRPASLGTFAGCRDNKPKPSIKFGVCNVFSLIKNFFGKPCIGSLLFSARPFAIFGAIVSTIIYPFNTESFGSFPHVSGEVFKRVSPPIANRDSTPTVILEVPSVKIEATINNSAPDAVEWVIGGLHSVNDLAVNLGLPCFIITPARSGITLANISEPNIGSIATITNAVHGSNSSNSSTFSFGLNNQFSVTSSAFYNQFFRHGESYNNTFPNVNTFFGNFNTFT